MAVNPLLQSNGILCNTKGSCITSLRGLVPLPCLAGVASPTALKRHILASSETATGARPAAADATGGAASADSAGRAGFAGATGAARVTGAATPASATALELRPVPTWTTEEMIGRQVPRGMRCYMYCWCRKRCWCCRCCMCRRCCMCLRCHYNSSLARKCSGRDTTLTLTPQSFSSSSSSDHG